MGLGFIKTQKKKTGKYVEDFQCTYTQSIGSFDNNNVGSDSFNGNGNSYNSGPYGGTGGSFDNNKVGDNSFNDNGNSYNSGRFGGNRGSFDNNKVGDNSFNDNGNTYNGPEILY
ncbi:insoluble matrix shell protein 4-like [Erythrolamprus reginae]|uniref:insoluble matrix shell protein 4-like n=1 Tax=Erythrolamprus reginae TaxID=121349 RepID=UPI00396CF6BF